MLIEAERRYPAIIFLRLVDQRVNGRCALAPLTAKDEGRLPGKGSKDDLIGVLGKLLRDGGFARSGISGEIENLRACGIGKPCVDGLDCAVLLGGIRSFD